MKKTLIFVVCVLFSNFYVFAQINEQEAFQKFKQGREAFQNSNYLNAANLLIETKNLLGSTNIRIQPMLIKSLSEIGNWHKAKEEIISYYGLDPDKSLVEYQEIVTIERQVDLKIKEDIQLYHTAKNSKSVSVLQSYLDVFPYGKYKSEVASLLSTQKDEDAWQSAKIPFNTEAYEAYLLKFPEGIHSSEARQQIANWDATAYSKASKQDTQNALNNYLLNFPNGKYRTQIQSQLNQRQEEDVYKATNSGNLEDFENYLRKYPNGKYSGQINRAIENYMFKKAEDSFINKYYFSAIGNYRDFINRFPNSERSDIARARLKKATNKSKQISSGYFGFTYESQGAFGITAGKLNKDKLGFYFNVRVTPEVFDIQFSKPENEVPKDLIPDDEKIGVASLSFGVSYPVAYPVWLYVGAGANYQERFIKNNNDENAFFRVEGEKQLAFYPEGGLKIRFGKSFTLIGGFVYVRGEMLYKVGIGF